MERLQTGQDRSSTSKVSRLNTVPAGQRYAMVIPSYFSSLSRFNAKKPSPYHHDMQGKTILAFRRIVQKEGIMYRRAHTDVGDDAGHQHRGDLALAQVEIEVGAKERAIAAFAHDNIFGRPMHGVHQARPPGVYETVRDPLLKQGIIGTTPLIGIKDGEVG